MFLLVLVVVVLEFPSISEEENDDDKDDPLNRADAPPTGSFIGIACQDATPTGVECKVLRWRPGAPRPMSAFLLT